MSAMATPTTARERSSCAPQAARRLDPGVRLPGPISKFAPEPCRPEHAHAARRRLARRPKGLS